ncbi:hypothetical protein GGR56DRAFT_27286 [Xylariaceae sp. FL0804]|nr:hypothetical protein GGR56DRAFT_27286 [Xylariaceae sp. FL0804]
MDYSHEGRSYFDTGRQHFSAMSVDGGYGNSARRYMQAMHEVAAEDDYNMLSPGAPAPAPVPESAKRRRFNGPPPGYAAPPPPHTGSPQHHMGYVPVADARYAQHQHQHQQQQQHQHQQQRAPSMSIPPPPGSATGYGPGAPLPQPQIPWRAGSFQGHPVTAAHLQPPPAPRRSVSYNHAQQQQQQQQQHQQQQQQKPMTPQQPSAPPESTGFDESLRLPPLQTTQMQTPNSPAQNPETGRTHSPMSGIQLFENRTAVGPVRRQQQQQQQPQQKAPPPPPPPQQHPHQHQHQHQHQKPPPTSTAVAPAGPPRWPFLLKLEVLRSIAPPLQPPGPGGPAFETRGPIIAIEGAVPASVLREVASVVEKALAVSGEYAVKLWSEDNNNSGSSSNINNSSNDNKSTSKITNIAGAADANRPPSEVGKSVGETAGNSTQPQRPPQRQQQQQQKLMSPLAGYVARMLKWHKTSEELIRYVTRHPAPPPSSPLPTITTTATATATTSTTTNDLSDGQKTTTTRPPPPLLPVAVLADGYSLTHADRYAAALHVGDAYGADDHWQWVATLWRGVVGADLSVCVKQQKHQQQGAAAPAPAAEADVQMAGPNVMVVRVPPPPPGAAEGGPAGGGGSGGGGGGGGGVVDERLERRLGFEISEWVRGGGFRAGFLSG